MKDVNYAYSGPYSFFVSFYLQDRQGFTASQSKTFDIVGVKEIKRRSLLIIVGELDLKNGTTLDCFCTLSTIS